MKLQSTEDFWDWFQKNYQKTIKLSVYTKKERNYLHNELRKQLKACCGGDLRPQVIVDEENNRALMIVSAAGDPDYFNFIESLVQQAPTIEGWTIRALYPPVPGDWGLAAEFPNLPIKADDMLFAPSEICLNEEDTYDVQVYVKEGVDIEEAADAAVKVVYNVLGEKSTGLNIRAVNVKYFEDAAIEIQVECISLNRLPEFIVSGFSGLNVDEKGGMAEQ